MTWDTFTHVSKKPLAAALAVSLLAVAIAAGDATKLQNEISHQKSDGPVDSRGGAAKDTPTGNIASGKQHFMNYGCYECHGTEGAGGTGPRISRPSLSITAITRYVRHPSGQMPPYTRDVLTDDQLADIYAYLDSIPPPKSASSLPLLE
jgi:mono/diheme cytochrome c family protein